MKNIIKRMVGWIVPLLTLLACNEVVVTVESEKSLPNNDGPYVVFVPASIAIMEGAPWLPTEENGEIVLNEYTQAYAPFKELINFRLASSTGWLGSSYAAFGDFNTLQYGHTFDSQVAQALASDKPIPILAMGVQTEQTHRDGVLSQIVMSNGEWIPIYESPSALRDDMEQISPGCSLSTPFAEDEVTFSELADQHTTLLAKSFECGAARVATLTLGESQMLWPLEAEQNYRSACIEDLQAPLLVDAHTMVNSAVAGLMHKLDAIDLSDGSTVLDNTLIVVTSVFGDCYNNI